MIRRSLRSYRSYLQDILNAMNNIIDYKSNLTYHDYCLPGPYRDAILYNFQIMGEAVKHIPRSFQNKNKRIPWNYMAAIRNDIVHEYYDPDDEIVWSIMQVDLENNAVDLKQLLENF
jgi:uncharacterized protein with HEPN domain